MLRTLTAAALASAVALAAPAAPAAAQTPVSGRTIDAYPASLAFDLAGFGVASWRGLRGSTPDDARPFVAVAKRTPGAAWHRAPALPSTITSHSIALERSGRIALATTRETPLSRNRSRTSVIVNMATTRVLRFARGVRMDSGPARRVTFEGPQSTLALPKVAFVPGFSAYVAWQRTYPRSQAGVWLGGLRRFNRKIPARLMGRFGGEPYLAFAADDSGVLAWRRGRRVIARLRTPAGRWTAAQTAATVPAGGQIEHVELAVGPGRRSLIAVVATRRTEAGIRVRASVHAWIAGAGWRAGVLGDYTFQATPTTSHVSAGLRALPLFTSDGRMLVAWPRLAGGRIRVSATELIPEAGGIGSRTPLDLSDPAFDASAEDVAAGPDGRFAVAWFDLGDGRGSPSVSEIDANGAVVTTPRLATERALVGTQVAYNPTSGRPTVIWSQGGPAAGHQIVSIP